MGRQDIDGLAGIVPEAVATPDSRRVAAPAGARPDRPLRKDDLALLGRIPLFASLPRRHLRRLAEHADVVSFREREEIVREGQPGGTFYVIVRGEAKVRRGGRTVGTLGPGEFFGEISLLDGGPRTADVVAATPVSAIRVFKKAFDRLVTTEPGVAARILAVVARRLRETERSVKT